MNIEPTIITQISYTDNEEPKLKVFDLGVPFKNVFLKESSGNGVTTEFTLNQLYNFLEEFFKTSPFTAWTWSPDDIIEDYGPADPRIKTWFQIS